MTRFSDEQSESKWTRRLPTTMTTRSLRPALVHLLNEPRPPSVISLVLVAIFASQDLWGRFCFKLFLEIPRNFNKTASNLKLWTFCVPFLFYFLNLSAFARTLLWIAAERFGLWNISFAEFRYETCKKKPELIRVASTKWVLSPAGEATSDLIFSNSESNSKDSIKIKF